MKEIVLRGLMLVLLIATGLSVSDTARSAESYTKTVQLIAGKADTVELSGAVADVLVANPAIADVGTLRSDRLYIVGKSVGDTNVLAYDEAGNQLANLSIHVRIDDKNLQETLKEFFPDEKIFAHSVNNNIVLTGTVSSPGVSNQVRDLATRFLAGGGGGANQTIVDLMKVRGEQQVMLKVKVMEVDKTVLRELGVTSFIGNGHAAVSRGDRVPVLPVPLGGLISGQQAFATGAIAFSSKLDNLTASLEGLETQGLVNTLAEPNLTAINGETAGFLAGGEFPIPGSKDAQGNVVIDYKQFGVSLNFTPTVMNKDRIALHLSTEVSDRDVADGITLQGLTVPALSERKAETTVELGSGNTIMIAGLLKASALHNVAGLPGVQNLPIIGELFKSKSFQRGESELVIIVTPYLVNSYAEADAVASKTVPPALPGPLSSPPLEKLPAVPVKSGEADLSPAEKAAAVPVKAGKIDWAAAKTVPAAPPVKASMQTPAKAPVQEAQTEDTVTPPAQSLMNHLRKVYGDKAVEKVGTGPDFGYIVE